MIGLPIRTRGLATAEVMGDSSGAPTRGPVVGFNVPIAASGSTARELSGVVSLYLADAVRVSHRNPADSSPVPSRQGHLAVASLAPIAMHRYPHIGRDERSNLVGQLAPRVCCCQVSGTRPELSVSVRLQE